MLSDPAICNSAESQHQSSTSADLTEARLAGTEQKQDSAYLQAGPPDQTLPVQNLATQQLDTINNLANQQSVHAEATQLGVVQDVPGHAAATPKQFKQSKGGRGALLGRSSRGRGRHRINLD